MQAAGPVVSDEALALRLCGKELPQKRKVEKQGKCLLGEEKSTVRVDRHTRGLRERVAPSWWLESLLWGISSGFPLASHLALPASVSVFVYLGVLPCACTCLSQGGFHRRGLWGVAVTYCGAVPLPF